MITKKILMIVLAVCSFSSSYASAEVVCECWKIWAGGDARDFRGYKVDAGSVTGQNYAEALDNCRYVNPPFAHYNAALKNCSFAE